MTDSDLAELFWANSAVTRVGVERLRRRIDSYLPTEGPRLLTYPPADIPLPRPRDGLARLQSRRQSRREFGPGQLTLGQLGGVLGGLAANDRGTRAYPSAGGLYPLETFCLANAVGGGLSGKVLCHNPDNHTLSVAGPLPPWDGWRDALNFACASPPQAVVVLVAFPDRTLDKYGPLGARFVLIEVGHAAQNLALRVEQEGLAGCELGAVVEHEMVPLLGLEGERAWIPLAYAVGLPAHTR